jgi:hypothetical protein
VRAEIFTYVPIMASMAGASIVVLLSVLAIRLFGGA